MGNIGDMPARPDRVAERAGPQGVSPCTTTSWRLSAWIGRPSPMERLLRRFQCHSIKEGDMTDKQTDTNYAGRSQEERRAQRKGEKQRAQEQPGGHLAEEGTEPDKHHSSGKLSEDGKKVWQTGSGIDGGGRSR
jgi:hypothetical protein